MGFKLKPCVALVYLTLTNMMIYADRGILASIIKVLETSEGLELNNTQAGSLGSYFMLGFMLSGFFFAHYSQVKHPFSLIAVGLGFWSLTALGTGLSRNYWQIALARGLSGVGEVSFACLGPPLVLEYAPKDKKTVWIAVFYSAIAMGFSFGYIFGATIYSYFNAWHYPFFFEAIFIFVLCLFALFTEKEEHLLTLDPTQSPKSLASQLQILLKNLQYVFVVLGFTSYIFTVGAVGFWVIYIQGPYVLQEMYNLSMTEATQLISTITITCGIFGTISGSLLLDYNMKKDYKNNETGGISNKELMYISVEKSSLMLFIYVFIATGFLVAGGIVAELWYYIVGFSIGTLFLFALKGPVAIALMNSVDKEFRGQANAVAIFFMHLLGDFPSPFFIGFLFDHYSLYVGVLVMYSWLVIAIIAWGLSYNISVISIQRFHGANIKYILSHFCSHSEPLLIHST